MKQNFYRLFLKNAPLSTPFKKCIPYLNLLAGWRAAPRALLAAWGARYAASGGIALALLLGLLANFTVIGSVAPSGMVPFSFWMALSASMRWSKRMNPTPFESPGTEPSPLEPPVIRELISAKNRSQPSKQQRDQQKSWNEKLFMILISSAFNLDFLPCQDWMGWPKNKMK